MECGLFGSGLSQYFWLTLVQAELQELSQLVAQAVDALEEQEKRILSTGVSLEVQCATDVVRQYVFHV